MFDLLSRLPRLPALPLRPQRMAQALLSAPVAAMSRSLAAHRAWPGAVVGQLIDHLLQEGSFVGALDDQPGFAHRRMADGKQYLRHQTRLCGASVTPRAVMLQFAQSGATIFARQTLSTLIEQRFGHVPLWLPTDEAGLRHDLSLAPGLVLSLATSEAEVDPLFIGGALPGMAVTLSLRQAG